MKDPMLNKDFLIALDRYSHNFTWVKIVALNWEEYPMEEISGKVVSGSINVDGSSAVRRTCSLSLVANDINIHNFYWCLNSKFKVFIGLENHIDSEYPDIIWFNQGIFLISSFSCSVGVNNYSINIQGKDKMCLLNGDVGGVIPASWDFGKIDITNSDGTISQDFYPIKDIVLQAVHEYAQEPWQNIIVNDLDDYGLELLQYEGTNPIYLAINTSSDEASQIFLSNAPKGSYIWYRKDSFSNGKRQIGTWVCKKSQFFSTNIKTSGILCYDGRLSGMNIEESKNYLPIIIGFSDNKEKYNEDNNPPSYTLIEVNNGDTCGYRLCDIIYPYDLIASPGDSLTSILDKLVQMLGNFEYFFDVEGRFIFQKKKTYIDVSWNNIINEHSISNEVWANDNAYSNKYSYIFDDNVLVSSIQNSPNLNNLKNDYSLWGRRGDKNSSVPIHLRYAIDKKPKYYKNFKGKVYQTEGQDAVDWRELIYQMANDYRRHYRDKDFNITLRDLNKVNGVSYYPTGYTGYEKYYVDFEMNLSQGVVAYWRELYNPEQKGQRGKYLPNGTFKSTEDGDFIYDNEGWNYNIINNPESLNFWFDFLDTSGELDKYKVCYIGQRSKVMNDDKIKSIYFRDTPNIIYYTTNEVHSEGWTKPGYSWIAMNNWDLFNLSTRGKSALDILEEYLYSYSYPATAITLTTVPIYYLAPNSLIYLNDAKTGAVGEYIMQKFSFQLGNTSSMSITAVETANRLR